MLLAVDAVFLRLTLNLPVSAFVSTKSVHQSRYTATRSNRITSYVKPFIEKPSTTLRPRLFSSALDSGNDISRIVFLGTPDVAADSLRSLVEESRKEGSPYEVVGVVTQPPKRRKRRGKVIPSPVGEVADELDIPVLCPEKAKDPSFLDDLEYNIKPDLCITAAYGQYLPKRFLSIPKFG